MLEKKHGSPKEASASQITDLGLVLMGQTQGILTGSL